MEHMSKKAKRYLALAMSILMVFGVLPVGSPLAKAEGIPVVYDFNAAYATTLVNIDGIADEADWQVIQELKEGVTENTSNTAKFGAMWDENYLYIAADVTDASRVNNGGDPWDDDSLELYIDTDLSRSYNNHTVQYIFKWNDPVVYTFNSSLSDAARIKAYANGVIHKSVQTTNGYAMEVAIPWSAIDGITAPAGKSIGITAHVNDRDEGNSTLDTIQYTPSHGDGDWADATNWARVTLSETGDPSQIITPVIYEFTRLGGLAGVTNPQPGWVLGNHSESASFDYQSYYGFHTENYDLENRFADFKFTVPSTGEYTLKLKGFLAGGGAICDIKIDGLLVGQYDFYGAGVFGELKILANMQLTQGEHILTIAPVSRSSGSWGYNIYANQFVLEQQLKLAALKLGLDYSFLVEGQSEEVKLSGVMTDGTSASFDNAVKSFTSSNPTVASVDAQTGVITAVTSGAAIINTQVTLNGKTMNKGIKVTVISPDMADIRLAADKTLIIAGRQAQMRLAGSYKGFAINMPQSSISVNISDESIISIDSNNVITALKEGSATIQAEITFGTVTRQLSLDITVEELSLLSAELTAVRPIVYTGQTTSLVVSGVMNSGEAAVLTGAAITYSSQKPEIATVDPVSGLVTPVAPGKAVLGAVVTLNNVTKSCSTEITVNDASALKGVKTKASLYTAEKIANVRNNIANYDWAKAEKDKAVAKADEYLALGEDFWWNIVTSQSIPRSFSVNEQIKCPICGADIYKEAGNYPWIIDPINHPWKLTCPKCKNLFPANDFGAYYKSGLDTYGRFSPEKADKSLLKNTLYPDKPENWCVDNGCGSFGEDASQKLFFIAYYNHWGLWYNAAGNGIIQSALDAFRDAYLYTGDAGYAHMGTILLDRVADVYLEMDSSVYKWEDGYRNSHGGTGLGNILGSIWETIIVPSYIRAYDAFYPAMNSENTVNYLKVKADRYNLSNPKVTGDAIRKNIEDGILRQVLPGVRNCRLEGNTGMQQSCIALAAVVFDSLPETKELIDFNYNACVLTTSPRTVTGGGLLPILVNDVDRDGQGNECAPGYNYLWLQQLKQVADVMDGYTLPGLDSSADLYQNPKFIKMFKAFYPLILSSRYTAAIGDTGGTGKAGIIGDLTDCVKGFEKTGDTVLGQLAYYINHDKADGIHSDIFSANPSKVTNDIKAIISQQGELKLNSTNMTGFGFAALRDGVNYVKDAGITYQFKDMQLVSKDVDFAYYSSSGTMQFEAMEDGKTAVFSFMADKADNYEIDLKTFKASSYGIYDIYIDDQKLATYDFYGSTGAGNPEKIGNIQLAAGSHTIKFTGNGRNAANTSAYKMGIIQLSLLDAAAQEIKRISEEKGDTQRDAWMYYGHNGNHGHADSLNLGLHAFGVDVAPEMGYPEYTGPDPKRLQWESNTIGHNTVVVDNSKQSEQMGGTPIHFEDNEYVKLVDSDAKGAYKQTSMYRRTTALIKVDEFNSYTIDLFRIFGGSNHNFSFHSNEGTVTTEGLNLAPQVTGTYAGPNINYGERYDSVDGWSYNGSGYHYLKNVEKDNSPAGQFSVDWKIDPKRSPLPFAQDVHLKLTMLTQANDVALADGVPPQRPGNPDTLKYLVVNRTGENLKSLFTSILQPYKDSPFIESITGVEIKESDTVIADESVEAVKIVLKNGRIDYVVNALDSQKTYTVDGKFTFKGFFGVYSEKDGKQTYGYVCDGTAIGKVIGTDSITGTVAGFTKELSNTNEIIANLGNVSSANALAGRYVYISNDGVRNASYRINSASLLPDGKYRLDISDTTLIRSYVDQNDFSKGFVYDIAEGQQLVIPLSTEVVQVDSAAPSYSLQANGRELTEGCSFEDSKLITFSAQDPLSGLKAASVTIDGKVYEFKADGSKVEINLAGKTGKHTAVVNVEDNMENRLTKEIHFNITTSIASMKELVSRYEKSGELNCVLSKPILLNLQLAQTQLDKGKPILAAIHMKAITTLLNTKLMSKYISPEAKAALNADANVLINLWLKKK